jgi:short-subunit dehydrogenase
MKRALITGASSGLGEGLARLYGAPGATIGLVGRREEALRKLAAELEQKGARPLIYPADVRDTEIMAETARHFFEHAGGCDVVIANAGIGEGRRDQRFDSRAAAEVLHVNVIGLTNTLLPWVELMRAQGSGTLVGMASIAGYRAIVGSLSYSASKAAVMTFMEGLQMELDGTGVHAMAICPGFVRTPLTDKNDFKMPFRIECDDACLRMKKAIDAKKRHYTFPLPMLLAAQLMRVAPQWVLKRSSPRWRERKRAQLG